MRKIFIIFIIIIAIIAIMFAWKKFNKDINHNAVTSGLVMGKDINP